MLRGFKKKKSERRNNTLTESAINKLIEAQVQKIVEQQLKIMNNAISDIISDRFLGQNKHNNDSYSSNYTNNQIVTSVIKTLQHLIFK